MNFPDTIQLLRELIRTDTCNPPGNERPANERLGHLLESAGYQVTLDLFDGNRASLIARLKGKGEKGALAFCGHIDTVPVNRSDWTRDPHGADIENGYLYGRGAVDMKGGVAAMVSACIALASAPELSGDVLFLGTAGEEVDCAGACRLAEQDLGPIGALVVGEPTRLQPAIAHKGALWLEFTTTGKAAHGSMPSEGYNAIVAMNRLLSRILERPIPPLVDPLLGSQTQSIGAIHGGSNVNIVADSCRLTIDIRTLPGQSHGAIIDNFNLIMDALQQEDPSFRAGIKTLTSREAVSTPPDDAFIAAAIRTLEEIAGRPMPPKGMTYFTDASVLQPALRVPVLVLGPGDERLAHQADEHVSVADVMQAARIYAALANSWLR